MISTAVSNESAVIFYSTIPIVESSGEPGPMVTLSPPMNSSISSIQVFQCSLSLVRQVASVDSQTRQLLTVQPDFTKTNSKWMPYTEVPDIEPDVPDFEMNDSSFPNITNGNMLIDMVGSYIYVCPGLFSVSSGDSGIKTSQPLILTLMPRSLSSEFLHPLQTCMFTTACWFEHQITSHVRYFIQKLNLPENNSNTRNITLHDFENALSVVVASMFWTCQ
jgi:hypothetical protein